MSLRRIVGGAVLGLAVSYGAALGITVICTPPGCLSEGDKVTCLKVDGPFATTTASFYYDGGTEVSYGSLFQPFVFYGDEDGDGLVDHLLVLNENDDRILLRDEDYVAFTDAFHRADREVNNRLESMKDLFGEYLPE